MRRILKWFGVGVAGLVVLGSVAFGGAVVAVKRGMARVHDLPAESIAIPTDEGMLEEGKRLVSARGCAECHGPDLGGRFAVDDPTLGKLYAPNLTGGRGTAVEGYRDEDWIRSIRHGVKRDGRPTLMMPANEYYLMSDRELGAVIAYAKAAPAVDRPPQQSEIEPLLYVLGALNFFPLLTPNHMDHDAPRPPDVEPAATAAFGDYLASLQCKGCHGATLGGGPFPGAPPSLPVPANLTPDAETGLGRWSEADFVRALREGKRPDDRELNAFMPWKTYAHMNDTEVAALWAYLRSVPPKPFGSR